MEEVLAPPQLTFVLPDALGPSPPTAMVFPTLVARGLPSFAPQGLPSSAVRELPLPAARGLPSSMAQGLLRLPLIDSP